MILLPLVFCVTISSAQTIPEAVSDIATLSILSELLASSPRLSAWLLTANNFTFLAPSNAAISQLIAGNYLQDGIEATLTYHLLSGSYPTVHFGNVLEFIPTALSNASFANVTGGQRVEVTNTGNVTFRSQNKTSSSLLFGDIIIDGGIIHVIDTVLQIPLDYLTTASDAALSYFIAIVNQARFMNSYNPSLVDTFVAGSDFTLFAANSAAALSQLNTAVDNGTDFLNLFGYQVVAGSVLYSRMFKNGTQLTTMNGLPAIVTVLEDGTIYINAAKIIASDYLISNGVMHVIDSLLIPGNTTGPAVTSSATIIPSPPSTSTPGTSHSPAPRKLSTAASAGIGIGVGIGLLSLVILGGVLNRKRKFSSSHSTSQGRAGEQLASPRCELSSSGLHETPQMETCEHAVELPASNT